MGDKSRISWTDATWNCLLGCSRVSAGCLHCYAIRDVWRMAHNPNPTMARTYAGLVELQPNGQLDWTGVVRLIPERLDIPLRWARPRRIFVNSLSDVFHETVPFEDVDRMVAVMAVAKQHIFQVLTKRPNRMAEYLCDPRRLENLDKAVETLGLERGFAACTAEVDEWPLPNVWWGTSVEDQRAANERIPHLLRCRAHAAVLWLSLEPLLGPVDLSRFIESREDELHRVFSAPSFDNREPARLDWIVVGGESGKDARPMHPQWARDLRDQAVAAGVGFEFKQHGEFCSLADAPEIGSHQTIGLTESGKIVTPTEQALLHGATTLARVGKRAAGRLLDGVEWNQWPRGTTPFVEAVPA